MRIETLAVHAGHDTDPATGAVTPPIHLSTTFARDAAYGEGLVYTRYANPNRLALETALAALEGGGDGGTVAAAFASGSAATAAVFQALEPGMHVIAPDDVYFGTGRLLREQFVRWGLRCTFVDMTDAGAVERAVRPETRLIWAESPSNPLVRVTDLARMAEIARAAGARLAVDNTWATPVLTRPLELGADIVMHSTTKYLGGHSDVLGGALVWRGTGAYFEQLRTIQSLVGAVPSPFDCWLVARGLRTLPLRMQAQSERAAAVAAFLEAHPAVARVHYPGLASHPQHAVAARQMAQGGAMLSIEVRGGAAAALRLTERLTLFTRATSLGGVESLIEHRRSVEGEHSRSPESLLRVSIGLEHADDLIADLAQALDG